MQHCFSFMSMVFHIFWTLGPFEGPKGPRDGDSDGDYADDGDDACDDDVMLLLFIRELIRDVCLFFCVGISDLCCH